MIAKSHPISWIAALLIVGTSISRAACTPDSPTGHFQGTATSKEAGKLEISLDLRCVNQQYQGELVTPVGTYTVSSGSDMDLSVAGTSPDPKRHLPGCLLRQTAIRRHSPAPGDF
jgi:hypothetical protein